jgi:glycerate kinase
VDHRRVRILVAPDRVGPAAAAEVAAALRQGWTSSSPDAAVDELPLSDGGPGFLDVVAPHLAARFEVVTARGPLGDPVPARVLVAGDTAYVESAEVLGRHLVAADPDVAARAGSEGLADLLLAAAATARTVVVGVGGTATTDGGCGMVEALGGRAAAAERLDGVRIVAATATDAPLLGHSGAAHGSAAAKGADRATRDLLEQRLREWATATDGALAVRPGAGAGGGVGFGLLLLGADRVPGTQLVADLAGLPERVRRADLAVTAAAVLDWDALRGRVVTAVARAAQASGRPTVVLAERVDVGRRELGAAGIDAAYAVADLPDREAGHTPAGPLAALAARVARTWSR